MHTLIKVAYDDTTCSPGGVGNGRTYGVLMLSLNDLDALIVILDQRWGSTKSFCLREYMSMSFSTKKYLCSCTDLSNGNDRELRIVGSTIPQCSSPYSICCDSLPDLVAILSQLQYRFDLSMEELLLFTKLKRTHVLAVQ